MMNSYKVPRAVVVTRPTDYENLLARHGTRGQARFFLQSRGQAIEPVEEAHQAFAEALAEVRRSIPARWRRTAVARRDLDRFLFEPDDVVVAVGQDGLVANAAKYLSGQPVVGINPDPGRHDGILVPHPRGRAGELMEAAAAGRAGIQGRTMAQAALDDGQVLFALNEVYLGHATHQSARYRVRWDGREERQSSSGIIAATGTGATGWARSIRLQRRNAPKSPAPTEDRLAFFVREPFPSVATGTKVGEGLIQPPAELEVVSEMNEGGVLFGDGIESDRIEFPWGARARIGVAGRKLNLVIGC